jgi:hypothetical protein
MKIDTRRSMERKNDRGNYSGDRGSRSVSADRKSRTDLEQFDPRSSYPYNAHEVKNIPSTALYDPKNILSSLL